MDPIKNPEKLPKMVNDVDMGKLPKVDPVPSVERKTPNEGGKKGKKAGAKGKKKDLFAFTDGFTRLKTEQPPILETMNVSCGVILEHKGKSKKGPPVATTSMSREKYWCNSYDYEFELR